VELTPLAAFKPPTDVCESAEAVCIRIELPGVAANQIKIALMSDKIRVYGEKKKRNPRQKVISHLCSERNYGRFSRVVPLRWTISVTDTKAELKDGVLMIHYPRPEIDADQRSKCRLRKLSRAHGKTMTENINDEITVALEPAEPDLRYRFPDLPPAARDILSTLHDRAAFVSRENRSRGRQGARRRP
jgi:HSP20 family protein